MSLIGFQTLTCHRCEGTEVFPLFELIWQKGKGTSTRPKGYICRNCNVPFQIDKAIHVLERKELEDKIKEHQAALAK